MNKRSLRNGAIVVITLGALTGVGTMVASAGTGANNAAAPAGNSAAQRGNDAAAPGNNDNINDNDQPFDPNVSPSPFDPDVSPSPFDPDADPNALDPDQAAANANSCVAVQLINVQDNDDGQLCTTLQGNRVQVRLTAPDGACQDTVTLQLTTPQGANLTDTVPCAGNDSATATFTPGQQLADGSLICGVLAADRRFASARACVRAAA